MTKLMHPVEQGIADKADAGSLAQTQWEFRHHWFCGIGSLRRLSEHGVFAELRVLGKDQRK
jgi:hypothetical protein